MIWSLKHVSCPHIPISETPQKGYKNPNSNIEEDLCGDSEGVQQWCITLGIAGFIRTETDPVSEKLGSLEYRTTDIVQQIQ
jgi:hypothetical protein